MSSVLNKPRKAGRPKGARGKSNPLNKLQKYLNSGMEINDICALIEEWIAGESPVKFTERQLVDLVKLMFEIRKYLLEKDLEFNVDDVKQPKGKKSQDVEVEPVSLVSFGK